MTFLVKAEQLTLGYGARTVISDVDLSVTKGEFVGILGPNAAGKTTLLKGLCGLLLARSGCVLLGERKITTIAAEEFARRAAYVPQRTNLPFSFTVEEIVAMGRTPFHRRLLTAVRGDKEIITAALERMEVESLRVKTLEELSGGEAQRVIIARALAQTPRLLFLDEPTAHLDLGHQRRILDLLSDLNRREGLTVVMISHDVNAALRVCNRLFFLKNGRIVEQGTPAEITLREKELEMIYETPLSIVTTTAGNPVVVHQ